MKFKIINILKRKFLAFSLVEKDNAKIKLKPIPIDTSGFCLNDYLRALSRKIRKLFFRIGITLEREFPLLKRRLFCNKFSSGFSLVELLIVILIISVIFGSGFVILSTGKATWFTTDINIQLQENLRQAMERVTAELRQTQVAQQTILDGAGPNSSDVIRFAVPITCEAGANILDSNGDVAYWGAPLTWGCTDSTCMDADNDCATTDYSLVEYRLNDSNQLLRRVLDSGSNVVSQDIFAQNISNMQLRLSGQIINVTLSAEKTSVNNRVLTAQTNSDVFLRN